VIWRFALGRAQSMLLPAAGQKGSGLRPGVLLKNVLNLVPELAAFANLELRVVYNKDSSNVGPVEWKKLAMLLHRERDNYDAFLIIHGTDTMSYTASALSLMLVRGSFAWAAGLEQSECMHASLRRARACRRDSASPS
jgi:hypothetical protein